MSDDDVFGWGLSNYNQLGIFDQSLRASQNVRYFPERIDKLSGKGITRGSAATHHSLFLTSDGDVIAVGRWTDGRCGVRVPNAAKDGQLENPQNVVNLRKALKIACGGTNGAAILADGCAYVWGSQYVAQLGLGAREADAHLPEKLECAATSVEGKVFSEISFGGQHAAAILSSEDADVETRGNKSRKRARFR